MRHAQGVVAIVWLAVAANCSDDSFNRISPKLEITAYEDGNTGYLSVDETQDIINLGDVPVFATKYAIFKLNNPTEKTLTVTGVTYSSVTGERFKTPELDPPASNERFTSTEALDFDIGPAKSRLLKVPYAPIGEGDHVATLAIESDATNAKVMTITVMGTGVFTGAPDIEVEYNGYLGPAAQDCVDIEGDGVVDGCAIPPTHVLDFGNIGLGAQGTARLIIRNRAECTAFAGVDPCTLCAITLDKDPTRQNVGLAFKAGTNDEGLFAFEGSTQTPFDVQQRNLDCGAAGELRLLLRFNAPTVNGSHNTVVVLESNDPDEPLIEVPVRATAQNAPIAVAGFKEFDPAIPTAPYTNPSDIEPLTTVYFDGRESYDPTDPTNTGLIATYRWDVVEYPPGTDVTMFNPGGGDSALFHFWLPIAGHYDVKLTVWNTSGIQSGDTPESHVEFDVIPGSRVHIQLVWDDALNDQDLHLVYKDKDDRVCNMPWDCFYDNRTPIWFAGLPSADGPNPSLDIDDMYGLGPENINIDDPLPGTYRIYVHYFGNHASAATTPTRNTVRIYLNGFQAGEFRRTLNSFDQVWAVGDITWADGAGTFTAYPSNAAGEIGSVATMNSCVQPGWDFP